MRKPETYRNEIKSYIVRTGMTMTEVVDYLSDEYGWSRSVPNLSGKLKRGSLRYGEAVVTRRDTLSVLKNVTIGMGAFIHISKAYARLVSWGFTSFILNAIFI